MARRISWDSIALRPSLSPVHNETSSFQAEPQTYLPVLIYGTAWKKERTMDLVYSAIRAGFRAIDTAAQPKHYREDLVAKGIKKSIQEGLVRREDLYIQTKFTSVQGQDPENIPYDLQASITDQVHTSIKSSLRNFSFSKEADDKDDESAYIDTLVLHSPLPTLEQTFEAWAAAECYVPQRVRNLGISNCDLETLDALNSAREIRIKPAVIQNRFYQNTRYNVPLRSYCRQHGIVFQSFWTLTANPQLLRSPSSAANFLAREAGISPAAALYCLVLGLGDMTVLDGTTNESRMREDLEAPSVVRSYAVEQPEKWKKLLESFKNSIADTA